MTGAGLGYVLRGDRTDTLANRYWDRNAVDGQTIRPQALAGYDVPGANRSEPPNGRLQRLFARMGLGSGSDRGTDAGNRLEPHGSGLRNRITASRQRRQERTGVFGKLGKAWNRLWGREPETPDQTNIAREDVPISPGPLNPELIAEVLNYLTDERIRGEDLEWEEHKRKNGWSMSEYHCNEIAIRDMLRAGLNPGMYDQDTKVPDALAGYRERGLTLRKPVEGTYGLVYYRGANGVWRHVEQFRYEQKALRVYRTPGDEPVEKVDKFLNGNTDVSSGYHDFEEHLFVPTGWLPGHGN